MSKAPAIQLCSRDVGNLWTFIEHTTPQKLGYLFFRQKHIRISKTRKGIVPLRDRNSSRKK